ncbi:MAG: hypothetical protein Kow00114_29130 [Kiloniellaceae bacterium]
MQRARQDSRPFGGPLDVQSDRVFFGFLLLLCLAYDAYASVAYLTSFTHGIFDFAWRPIGRDFINYWTAGVAVFEGLVLAIFDAELFHAYQERLLGHPFVSHNWSYPPHKLLLTWPLGLLPYLWALALWSLVTLGLYLWAAAAGQRDRWVLLAALLLAPATYVNFSGGQNGFVTGALLIGGLRLLGPRPIVAGILFGILTVKPQLGILLPVALLAARQWTAIVSAGVTAAAMVGLSVLVFGWESWQAYIDQVIPLQTQIMNHGHGIFMTMMPSAYMGLRLLDVAPGPRYLVQGAMAAIAVAAVFWTFARCRDWDLRFGVLAVATFVASPYAFNYDMTTVSLVLVLLALKGLRDGFLPGERSVLAATWLLPIAIHWLNAAYLPVGALVLLGCLAYLLLRVRRSLGGENRQGFAWLGSGRAPAG